MIEQALTAQSVSRKRIIPITDIPWGIHFDMPAHTYHSLPGASASVLKCFWGEGVTPAHAKIKMDEKREPIEALINGNLIHQGILEPDKPLPKIVIPPDKYPAEKDQMKDWTYRANYCKQWKNEQEAAGNAVLTADQYVAVSESIRAVREKETARSYWETGRPEVSLILQDPETKLPVRCRIDWLPDKPFLVDVKSCRRADREGFTKDAYERGYHIQFALYLDMWAALCGANDPKPRMKVVAVETARPYAVQCFDCSDSMIEAGRRTYRHLLGVLAKCLATGEWPDYPEGETELAMPRFRFSDDWQKE